MSRIYYLNEATRKMTLGKIQNFEDAINSEFCNFDNIIPIVYSAMNKYFMSDPHGNITKIKMGGQKCGISLHNNQVMRIKIGELSITCPDEDSEFSIKCKGTEMLSITDAKNIISFLQFHINQTNTNDRTS